MKISKKPITAAESSGTEAEELNSLVWEDSIKYLQKCIDSLGAVARRDKRRADDAKDAIANLSVILLDLKG